MHLQDFCMLLHDVMQSSGKCAFGVMTMEISVISNDQIQLGHVFICVTGVHHKNHANTPSGFLTVKKIPASARCSFLRETTEDMWKNAAISNMIAQPMHTTADEHGKSRSSISFIDLSELHQCSNQTCWTHHCGRALNGAIRP